jgi:hypothetical protein|nr:MAG TPA: hypothetical protein [Caudoviricetes sp.]
MIKGDRIKLVNKMGVFTNVGEICEVVDVTKMELLVLNLGTVNILDACLTMSLKGILNW